MKLFNDAKGNVWAYEEDGSQDHLIPEHFIQITQDEADALNKAKFDSEFEAKSYSEKRAIKYPDFKDYLDGVVKGDQSQIQAYIDACLAVKEKYPKP